MTAAALFARDHQADTRWREALRAAHALAQESLLSEFHEALRDNSPLEEQMKFFFQRELSELESREHLSSVRYNESVLKDCLEELSSSPSSSPAEETTANRIPSRLAELLEVFYHRARGSAKREVIASYLSKYCGGTLQLKTENDHLKGQVLPSSSSSSSVFLTTGVRSTSTTPVT
jgi:hypothetical protein